MQQSEPLRCAKRKQQEIKLLSDLVAPVKRSNAARNVYRLARPTATEINKHKYQDGMPLTTLIVEEPALTSGRPACCAASADKAPTLTEAARCHV